MSVGRYLEDWWDDGPTFEMIERDRHRRLVAQQESLTEEANRKRYPKGTYVPKALERNKRKVRP